MLRPRQPRVLLVHTRYREVGGEEVMVEAEQQLLEDAGHQVDVFQTSNDVLTAAGSIRAAAMTLWNGSARRALGEAVRRIQPDVVHVHNTFPLLSPAVYDVAGPVVVQTLHNYRFICPAATLMRAGQPCERCVGRQVAWPAVLHGCYRGSRAASALAAGLIGVHRRAGALAGKVHAFIALTEFARDTFVRGGLPPDRLHVRPNYLRDDPGTGPHDGGFCLFAGRLAEEKGIRLLLECWTANPDLPPLQIVGAGPLEPLVREAAAGSSHIEYIGALPREGVLARMRAARLLVLPSIWYESFPVVLLEALATGLPVVGFALGSVGEVLQEHECGVAVQQRSATALAAAVAELLADGTRLEVCGRNGRRAFEGHYDRHVAYNTLSSIYSSAAELAHGAGHATAVGA